MPTTIVGCRDVPVSDEMSVYEAIDFIFFNSNSRAGAY